MTNENNSNLEQELTEEIPGNTGKSEKFEPVEDKTVSTNTDEQIDASTVEEINVPAEENNDLDEEQPKGIFAKLKGNKKEKNKEKLQNLEAQLAEQKDKNLRIFAEFDNFKKRTAKERIEIIKTAGKDVVIDLLSVLDDFDRATKAAEEARANKKPVDLDGFCLIHNKIKNLLSVKGLKEMETNGEVFDADLHDAITEIPAPEDNLKGKIVDTIEKGYYMNDVIIRHAKVVVGK